MKKQIIFLLLLLSVSIHFFAQSNTTYYYAVDGSRWKTVEQRDIKEKILWNEMEINLQKMILKGQFDDKSGIANKNRAAGFEESIKLVSVSVTAVRGFNDELISSITSEQIEILEQNGFKFDSSYAKNREWFILGEIREAFDHVLDFNSYLNNLLKTAAALDSKDVNAHKLQDALYAKIEALRENINIFEQRTLIKTKAAKARLNEKSAKSEVFRAIDGSTFKSMETRDKYESYLFENLNIKFRKSLGGVVSQETLNDLKEIISSVKELVALGRRHNVSLEKELRRLDLFTKYYKANNYEEFCTSNLCDYFNYVMEMYNVLDVYANDPEANFGKCMDSTLALIKMAKGKMSDSLDLYKKLARQKN